EELRRRAAAMGYDAEREEATAHRSVGMRVS
ncbi:MAG: hypothetical protein RLZZ423_762, partial [Cyanobacteriota bacterium]